MSGAWRGRRRRTAVAIWFAGVLPIFFLEATAAGAPRPEPTPATPVPVMEPVRLDDWARSVGGEASWVERGTKLRLKNAFREVVFELGRREVAIDGIRVFLGEAPKPGSRTLTISPVDRDRLLAPLLAPHRLPVQAPIRTIMLDAGHGGRDKGTTNATLKLFEKELALDVVQRLKPLLEARGYRVLLSRTDDTFIELGERPRRAATAGADLFLAVHFNAGPPTVHGIETYTLTPQFQRSTASEHERPEDNVAAPGNTWDQWNALLGYSIHRQLQNDLQRFDRGLKRARFIVIRDLATCPGVLIECGYLSNTAEAKLINTPAHRDRIAAAIAAGVDAFTAHVPDAQPAPSPPTSGAIRAPRLNPSRPSPPP